MMRVSMPLEIYSGDDEREGPMKKITLKITLFVAAVWLAGCILGKDKDNKEPGVNEFTISGPLAGLRHDSGINGPPPHFDYWFLNIDTIYPGREDLYSCTCNGFLGHADIQDYTNEFIDTMFLGSTQPFTVPSDTVAARNFTHWRLDITCPDSIPVPQ